MVNKFLKVLLLTTTITPLLAFNYVSRDKQNIQHQYLLNFEANGGSEVSPLIYINEDTTFKMPTTKKYGYTFGGWYFDNDTFEKPFYVGSSTIDENTTLYAKWVLKTVKVYLDTFYEDEFEPLIYNVGDTFHLSSLPEVVKNKKTNGLSFSFKNWVRGDEKEVVDDFVLEDEYYEFHATYGSLDYTSYKKSYETSFDSPSFYIDSENSWTRGELTLPKAGIGEGAPNQSVFLNDGNLTLNQLTYNGLAYGAKCLLPHDITTGLKKYSVETTFRISKNSGLANEKANAGDAGFGIMVGYNKDTGANVEAVVDPISKTVRIAAINSSYAKSGTDVNKSFSYKINGDLNDYHRLKAIYNGEKPNASGQLKNSYIEVYFDDVLCWSTKTTTLNKNWFYSNQANGDYIGLCANLCEAEIKSVVLKDFSEENTLYSYDFSKQNGTFADGWSYIKNSNGANVGQVDIEDGHLSINSYFPNQSIKKHQAIYSPCEELKNFVVSFDFNFENYSGIDKYFALMFRGEEARYNALFFRAENGLIQLYKHGEENSNYSAWSPSFAIKSYTGGFGKENHHIDAILKDNYFIVNVDGEEVYSNNITSNVLYENEGKIGFLTSSAEVCFDNLTIYNLDEVK